MPQKNDDYFNIIDWYSNLRFVDHMKDKKLQDYAMELNPIWKHPRRIIKDDDVISVI